MIAVLTLVFVLAISMVIIRIATVALTLTGLSDHQSRFQARSAFFGVGFTTRESEDVVNHPLRRRIITSLMLLGQVGIITTVATLVGSFMAVDSSGSWVYTYWGRITVLSTGIAVLLWLGYSRQVERLLSRAITYGLRRWTTIEVQDYAWLLRMSRNYAVLELAVEAEDWLAGRTLSELELKQEGVLVLGIERASGHYLGVPRGDTRVMAGDLMILYGHQEVLTDLDLRRADFEGQFRHVIAVTQAIDAQEAEKAAEAVDGPEGGKSPQSAGESETDDAAAQRQGQGKGGMTPKAGAPSQAETAGKLSPESEG